MRDLVHGGRRRTSRSTLSMAMLVLPAPVVGQHGGFAALA